jgi:hypothetical protein
LENFLATCYFLSHHPFCALRDSIAIVYSNSTIIHIYTQRYTSFAYPYKFLFVLHDNQTDKSNQDIKTDLRNLTKSRARACKQAPSKAEEGGRQKGNRLSRLVYGIGEGKYHDEEPRGPRVTIQNRNVDNMYERWVMSA